jgi:hypothetical protein
LFQGGEFRLTKEQVMWVVDIMLAVTLVKLLLVMYCRSFTNEIVKAYAQDHFFDVITNIIGLVAALLANYFEGWIDPVGAIIVSAKMPFLFFLCSRNIKHVIVFEPAINLAQEDMDDALFCILQYTYLERYILCFLLCS